MSSVSCLTDPGCPSIRRELDRQVEPFPLAVLAYREDELQGILLVRSNGSAARRSILWGAGVAQKEQGRRRHAEADDERAHPLRAAISFPDEDVVVAARVHSRARYVLPQTYRRTRSSRGQGYTPNGEDRAWGRRLAKRYGVDGHFDDVSSASRSRSEAAVPRRARRQPVKATGGAKIVSLVGTLDAHESGAHRVRVGGRRRVAQSRFLPRRILTDAPR